MCYNMCNIFNERLEIQNALNQILSKLRNYQEVTINHLTRKVTSQLSSLNGKDNKETASCIFYNMLIVCQNNQYQLRQSEPFGNFYIAKWIFIVNNYNDNLIFSIYYKLHFLLKNYCVFIYYYFYIIFEYVFF